MNEKLKKMVQNPLSLSIGSSVVATLIASGILSIFSNNTFINSIKIVLIKVLKFILLIFTFKISVWIILISIGFIVFILWVWNKTSEASKPDFFNYTTEDFKRWRLVWDYGKNYNGKYEIKNLRPICLCKCELSDRRNNRTGEKELYCPSCGKVFEMFYREDLIDANKIVEHKINTRK
jgi:Ca2+/Na+ antiporter